MTREDRSGGPGLGYVIAGAVVGVVVSLAAGLFAAALLNTWLAIDWVRGIATLAVGIVVAAAMLRAVAQTARGRLRAIRESEAPER
jgi:hypothetical protein